MTAKPLTPQQLKRACDPEQFPFNTTAELAALEETLGQSRAMAALDFGVKIDSHGYNVFAHGPAGYGKHTIINRVLQEQPANRGKLFDWCYINNFNQTHKPNVLKLPPGVGAEFSRDMKRMVEELHAAIPAAFESDEYNARVQELQDEYKARRDQAFKDFEKEANEHDVELLATRAGFALAAMRDGKILEPAEFQKLPEEQQHHIEEIIEVLQEKLSRLIRQEPKWQRSLRDQIRLLNREVATLAVEHLIIDIKSSYREYPGICDYLDQVQEDVVEKVEEFLNPEEERGTIVPQDSEDSSSYRRYRINVLVDQRDTETVPIVYEDNPTYQNLIGKVEHLAHFGTLVTDFLLIKPGALHRANGGYLLLDANKVLTHPFAYEALKRALQAREIRIQPLSDLYSLTSTLSLEPEPIPLDIKVILIGDRMLYYLLQSLDPEFSELFKVTADFEETIDRTIDNNLLYAKMIAKLISGKSLRAFDKGALAHVIDYASRLSEDQDKLSIHMHSVDDLLNEANYWAQHLNAEVVSRDHVQKAIDEKVSRVSRVRDRAFEEILRGTLMLDTEGTRVGQVNGLTVIDLGDFVFGQPARITATVNIGDGDIIDIEREVELGGPIHSKGVMILGAYLASRYAVKRPFSLAGHIVFEQSYGQIEGDSASAAELCALISAIADIPVLQSFAVTGSVNQHGDIQAIGGVNEKIEGFFDVCKRRGFSNGQGAIIPEANVKHLMLHDDVIEAVQAGKFHIYSVQSIDEMLELLTGRTMGTMNALGEYEENSINYFIERRLDKFADIKHEHEKHKDDED
jgi:lon-related putative ATP-dependent protease